MVLGALMALLDWPYSTTTFAQAKTALAQRLFDPLKVFWTDVELGQYLLNALQTWQAFSAQWTDRITAPLPSWNASGTTFYDIRDVATDFCQDTMTDQMLIDQLCDALMEPRVDWSVAVTASSFVPAVSAVWAGTSMFTLDMLTAALQRRRDYFLLETGLVATHRVVNGPSAPNGRLPLPQTVAAVRRAAWQGVAGSPAVALWPVTITELHTFLTSWTLTPDVPQVVATVTPPPLQLQLAPIPNDVGVVDLLTLEIGTPLAPAVSTAPGNLLGVPDDLAWVVLFGALADLLGQDGPARDPARAKYAQQRWQDGLALSKVYVRVLQAALNGVWQPTIPTVWDLDAYTPGWQGPTGAPTTVASAATNLLAVAPLPDAAAPYSLTLDVVRNMPLPSLDTDALQIGQEQLDPILDYAQHLASFKQGMAELEATQGHYLRLIELAKLQNARINGEDIFTSKVGARDRQRGTRHLVRAVVPDDPSLTEAAL